MIHLFGRTYLDHETFYNTKYLPIVVSSIEKPHPISEKLGYEFGKILGFQDFLQSEHSGIIDNFWSSLINKDYEKKKVIYADYTTYNQLLVQYWKSIFLNPDLQFIYELYLLQHSDNEVKLLMNIDRADNYKRIRPGDIPKISFKDFEKIYEESPVISSLKNRSKEDLSFELLMAEYHANPEGPLNLSFLHRLKRFCWRTWMSDLSSLRNDFLGTFYYFSKDLEVQRSIEEQTFTRWFLDPDFNENNYNYILKNYDPKDFKELYGLVNQHQLENDQENLWDSFPKLTEALFKNQYLELLRADIDNRKGCTFIRDHLSNESNQVMASKIYEDIRLGNIKNLEKFKLA